MGDIARLSPIARVLTIVEGFVGQFYIAFFISSVVLAIPVTYVPKVLFLVVFSRE